MKSEQSFKFDALPTADLIVDALYEGGTKGNTSDDPINRLLRGGNQGGFRYVGSTTRGTLKLVILYSSMDDVDWPDSLDEETGPLLRLWRQQDARPRSGSQIATR